MEFEFEPWAEASFGKYDGPYNDEYFKTIDPIETYIFLMALETRQLDLDLTPREKEFLENSEKFLRGLPLDKKIMIYRGEPNLVGENFRDRFILNI